MKCFCWGSILLCQRVNKPYILNTFITRLSRHVNVPCSVEKDDAVTHCDNVAWLSVTICLSFWMKERKKIRNTTDGGLHLLTRSGLQKNTQKITKVSHVDLVRFLLRKADRWYWNRRTMPRCREGSGLWGMGGGGVGLWLWQAKTRRVTLSFPKLRKNGKIHLRF